MEYPNITNFLGRELTDDDKVRLGAAARYWRVPSESFNDEEWEKEYPEKAQKSKVENEIAQRKVEQWDLIKKDLPHLEIYLENYPDSAPPLSKLPDDRKILYLQYVIFNGIYFQVRCRISHRLKDHHPTSIFGKEMKDRFQCVEKMTFEYVFSKNMGDTLNHDLTEEAWLPPIDVSVRP